MGAVWLSSPAADAMRGLCEGGLGEGRLGVCGERGIAQFVAAVAYIMMCACFTGVMLVAAVLVSSCRVLRLRGSFNIFRWCAVQS
jgi:hypothetical protein